MKYTVTQLIDGLFHNQEVFADSPKHAVEKVVGYKVVRDYVGLTGKLTVRGNGRSFLYEKAPAEKESKTKYLHTNAEIDAMLGNRVKVVDFDNDIYIGKIERNTGGGSCPYVIRCENKRYDFAFYKSHVRKIELL